jgi:chemotaxis protein methyltransferase CheR
MTSPDFDFVRHLVRDRSAIVLEPGKEYLVESRLAPLVRQRHLESVSDLIALARTGTDQEIPTQIIDAMVTTESSFFRDRTPFESLRTTILPDLIQRRRAERRLSVWCAACSTGQEPYSFAILLREHFPELVNWNVSVLATDISKPILDRAREGRFSQIEVNRGLPALLLVKYFRQHGSSWELVEDLRRSVEFRELNLAQSWPYLSRMDLVFLRNVMIYFDVQTKRTILGRLATVLRPDGYLLLGGAETTLNIDDSYHRVTTVPGGFYQRNG